MITVAYSDSYKRTMVQRMLGPNGLSATALSQQTHLPQNTLSRWLREAVSLDPLASPPPAPAPSPSSPARSAEDKLRMLIAYEAAPEDQRGALLRREGVLEAEVSAWRATLTAALEEPAPRPCAGGDRSRIRLLEREVMRKDKALAEAAALLLLQKKVRTLWGDEDAAMAERSGA